ncbi:MAG: hypothetical protein U9N35_04595 [Euryarchaeota archaeon]|nr:hypothetical protein [Euryarchaeota archaeon]
MNKKIAVIFLIIFLSYPIGLYGAQDDTLPSPEIESHAFPEFVHPGEEATIRVTVRNDMGAMMWNTRVYIDTLKIPEELREHVEVIVGNRGDLNLPSPMVTGDKETVELKIRITESFPAQEIDIPFIVDGDFGPCEGHGCKPFLVPKYSHIDVLTTESSILLSLDIKSFLLQAEDCGIITTTLDVPFTLRNVGASAVYNISFTLTSENLIFDHETEPSGTINELPEGEEISGKFTIYLNETGVGIYTITIRAKYHDRYNKESFVEEKITMEVRNEAYTYYAKAQEYYNSCEYSKAKEFYINAKNKYEEAGNTNMALKIERKIFKIQGNENFEQAQHYYFLGESVKAKEYYTQAKEYYNKANYCVMYNICEEALNSIEEGKTPPPESPGKTEGPGVSGSTGGIFPTINIAFYMIIALLILVIVYQRR